jgi:hypothetical protein
MVNNFLIVEFRNVKIISIVLKKHFYKSIHI